MDLKTFAVKNRENFYTEISPFQVCPKQTRLSSRLKEKTLKRILSLVALFAATLLLALVPQSRLWAQTTSSASTPETDDTYFQIARNLYLTNHFTDALEPLAHAVEINPDYADAYALRAEIYMNLSRARNSDALADIQKTFQLDSNNWYGYLARANYNANQEKYSDAIENVNQAIKLRPQSGDGYYMLGLVYLIQQDYKNAIDSFDKSLTHNFELFDTIWAYNDRGNAYYGLADYSTALKDYTSAINVNPSDKAEISDVLYRRALAEYQLNNTKAALSDLEISIGTTPEDHWSLPYTYNLRAFIYDGQSNNKAAISDYTRAIEISQTQELAEEDYSIFFRNRAFSYIGAGDCTSAMLDGLTFASMLKTISDENKSDLGIIIEQCKKQ